MQLSARDVYRRRLKATDQAFQNCYCKITARLQIRSPQHHAGFPFDVSFDPQDYRIWISILPWLAAAKLLRGRVASGGGCAKDGKLGPGSGSDNCLESDPFGSNQLGAMITEEKYCFLP